MSFGRLISQQKHRDQSEVDGVRKIVVYELLSLDGVAEDPDSTPSAGRPSAPAPRSPTRR